MKIAQANGPRNWLNIASGLLFFAYQASATPVVLFDDDMSLPNYSSFSLNNFDAGDNEDDVSSGDYREIASGGNPAEHLEIVHAHDVTRADDGPGSPPLNGNGSTFVQSVFSRLGINYNPSVDGPIDNVSFSIDVLFTDGPFSDINFHIDEIGGFGFSGGSKSLSPSPNWQTITSNNLTSADFSGINFAGSTPLIFGFGFQSEADVSENPEEFTLLVDNFKVTIEPVPEPTTPLLSLVTLGLLLRRRR